MSATVISRNEVTPSGQFPRFFCSECGAEILNYYSNSPYWGCAHSPWGRSGQEPTDRELLHQIAADVAEIKRRLG